MSLAERAKKFNQITKIKKNDKAKLITVNTPETKQLEIFTSSLGINKKTELYKYCDHIYINTDLIIPVLSVNINDFKKEADSKTHYIVLNKKVFVNKYGLIKLLAASREKAAFQLQDYIFEVIYKLETNKKVTIEEVESRKPLVKTLEKLKIYEMTNIEHSNQISQLKEEIKIINADYAFLLQDLEKERNNFKELEEQYKDLSDDYKTILQSAKKLARYVRFNTNSRIKEIEIDSSGDELEEDLINKNDKNRQLSDAKRAKKKITQIDKKSKSKTKSNKNDKKLNEKNIYYIMQSVDYFTNINGINQYEWKITTELPELSESNKTNFSDFKDFSDDYRISDNKIKLYDFIWHHDIIVNSQLYTILFKIIELIKYADETFIIALTDIFHQ